MQSFPPKADDKKEPIRIMIVHFYHHEVIISFLPQKDRILLNDCSDNDLQKCKNPVWFEFRGSS